MLLTIVNLLFVFVLGFFGATVASWLWYSHIRRQAVGASNCNRPPAPDTTVRLHKLATQAAVDFAVRLNDLVTQVAVDVGEHNSQVQKINDELASSTSNDSNKILDVVLKLVAANQQMQEKLAATEQKLREQTGQMQTLLAETRTDALTLLANRRAFDDELVKQFAESRRQGGTVSLTVMDVDRLKNVNDTCGHRIGDELLRNLAKVLRHEMRKTDVVARFGGDEFVIIHPGEDLAGACKAARRVCEAIGKYSFVHDGKTLPLTVSVGVAEMLGSESAAETFKRADSAMYVSKETGRNCIHFHDGNISRRIGANPEPVRPSADIHLLSQSVPCGCKDDEQAAPAEDAESRSEAEEVADQAPLWDLPGRTHFCQQVRNRMAEWKRGGAAFSVALIEASPYDKNEGNSDQRARESALRTTARFLLATIREMDVPGVLHPRLLRVDHTRSRVGRSNPGGGSAIGCVAATHFPGVRQTTGVQIEHRCRAGHRDGRCDFRLEAG